jgi:glycosyltransferase involved in cell wall biosynthesis
MKIRPLILDMTPWARGPHTGVGLTAYHSYQAIKNLLETQSEKEKRFGLRGVSREPASHPFSHFSRFQQWFGWKGGIYHSFELKLPQVKNCKRVVTIHDLWSLFPNPYQDPPFQKRQALKLKRAILSADHIAVPTTHVKSQITRSFPNLSTPISIIPWGPSINNESSSADNLELNTYLSKKRPYLLCVATLEKRKNYELLLSSISPELAKKMDLVTVGNLGFGGESIQATLQAMRKNYLGGIDLSKATPNDLKALYSQCLGLVLVSHDEGFGIPVLEALSFGKPIIASKISPLQEIAGSQASYIDLTHGESLLPAALNKLCTHSWIASDAETSRLRARQFSWELTAKKTIELYQTLL